MLHFNKKLHDMGPLGTEEWTGRHMDNVIMYKI